MRDDRIHAEKTLMGLSLAIGKTVGTGCGKRRERERTSTDPAKVTCLECRQWAAADELEMAGMADAAASIPPELIDRADLPGGPHDFRALAGKHRDAAARWSAPQESRTGGSHGLQPLADEIRRDCHSVSRAARL